MLGAQIVVRYLVQEQQIWKAELSLQNKERRQNFPQ